MSLVSFWWTTSGKEFSTSQTKFPLSLCCLYLLFTMLKYVYWNEISFLEFAKNQFHHHVNHVLQELQDHQVQLEIKVTPDFFIYTL